MKSFFDFIKKAKTPYHTIEAIKEILLSHGYTELSGNSSDFSDGGAHFVVKDGSSVIAFRGGNRSRGFMIAASHSDTPTFKVKSTEPSGGCTRLTVEGYGGMIYYSWLDRPLSLAGRVTVRSESGAVIRLVDIDSDLCLIPSVAIHLNRGVNDGYKFNPAVDMLPIISTGENTDLDRLISDRLAVLPEDIISSDLYLYNREEPRAIGADGELILSPRLDDLACVYSSLTAFLAAKDSAGIPVLAVFNNEEVGSQTKQGAASTFLDSTLLSIAGSTEKYLEMQRNSFMVSADNAHARHPNHPELSDRAEAPVLGGGVAIKHNANQRYTTDAVSEAVVRILADRCGVKLQSYSNRADIPGGSTLGSIANTKVGVSTVDIGIPQLAMHSASETSAACDIRSMISLLTELYSSSVSFDRDEIKVIK